MPLSVQRSLGDGVSKRPSIQGITLLLLFPRPAHFFRPVLVTSPIVQIIRDCGVTTRDPVRFRRWRGDSFDSGARRSADFLRRSSRSFAVAHLACLVSVRDSGRRVLSSTRTVPQAGDHRGEARVSIAMGISQRITVS
jgi:hypothetical protein